MLSDSGQPQQPAEKITNPTDAMAGRYGRRFGHGEVEMAVGGGADQAQAIRPWRR